MKKTFIIVLIVLLKLNSANAQFDKPVKPEAKNDTPKTAKQAPVKTRTIETKTIPTVPPPPPPPPPVPVNDATVYSLTSVSVNIRTGNDNKELSSTVFAYLTENSGIWGTGSELFHNNPRMNQSPDDSWKSEIKTNSNYEYSMKKQGNTIDGVFSLSNLQNKGLTFTFFYHPNFFSDAWKIETVTLTLEFKDQYGRLHPSFGNRIIQYNVYNGLLTRSNRIMKCTTTTDGFFTPLPVTITNTF